MQQSEVKRIVINVAHEAMELFGDVHVENIVHKNSKSKEVSLPNINLGLCQQIGCT